MGVAGLLEIESPYWQMDFGVNERASGGSVLLEFHPISDLALTLLISSNFRFRFKFPLSRGGLWGGSNYIYWSGHWQICHPSFRLISITCQSVCVGGVEKQPYCLWTRYVGVTWLLFRHQNAQWVVILGSYFDTRCLLPPIILLVNVLLVTQLVWKIVFCLSLGTLPILHCLWVCVSFVLLANFSIKVLTCVWGGWRAAL